MIRSIILPKKQSKTFVSRCKDGTVEKIIQRRLFASTSSSVGVGRRDDSKDEDRNELFSELLSNDDLRNTMVYSLAMGSLDGSKFPPLSRSLNEREQEQLRISRIQRRQFRSDGALAEPAEEFEKENAELRRQDRENLFRVMKEEQEIHNSMAYSLAMAMDLDDTDFLSLNRSPKNDKEKKRRNRSLATKQIYGENMTNDNDMESLLMGDIQADDYENELPSMAYSHSSFPPLTRFLNKREKEQLRISKGQLMTKCTTYPEQHRQSHPLPRTLQDALRPSSEAIVITENKMPFRVYNVNKAWEGLCGFSCVESKGKSLGQLLGGEETDSCAVTALIHQLFVHGEEATTVLTNYTKDGRKFRNRLSVGPLYDEETNEVSHFVGVLKEVSVPA